MVTAQPVYRIAWQRRTGGKGGEYQVPFLIKHNAQSTADRLNRKRPEAFHWVRVLWPQAITSKS